MLAKYEWQTFRSKWTREYYFRFVNVNNGKTISSSEGYKNRIDRDQSLNAIRVHSADAPVVSL